MSDLAKLLSGLVTPCTKCKDARKKLDEVQAATRDMDITADVLAADDGEVQARNQWVSNLQLSCHSCWNTGYVLTPEGQQLLAWFKVFQNQAGKFAGFEQQEIPF